MTDMNLDFSGKIALITGGSRGLGRETAIAMAKSGAHVMVCGRKTENLDRVKNEFTQLNLDIMCMEANVGKSEAVHAMFRDIDAEFGKLDILVNNVGTNIFTPTVVNAEEGLWDKIIETNLKSVFLTAGQAVGLMKKAGKGKIVNISSIAAKKAAMGMGIYCVAKAGVEMLTKVLAVEQAKNHINVNAVAPSVIRTSFSKPFWSDETRLKALTDVIPMGRIAEKADVVGTILFLASNLSDFITGEIITVDGGAMA